MDGYYDFGERLREARKKRKMTQKRLAEIVGVDASLISKYENNTAYPAFEVLRGLAIELQLSLDFLLGSEPRGALPLYGLSDEQADILKDLAELFRKQSGSVKRLSEEQYAVLGKIIENFIDLSAF